MSDVHFERAVAATAVTDQAAASYLRNRDTAQREAIATLKAERDGLISDNRDRRTERDTAQAQLAEAVGLLKGFAIHTFPSRELIDKRDAFLARHAQAEQQEAPRTCSDERPCVNCFADNGDCRGPDPQEAKGAPAVDERAAFESTLAPSLSRETFVDEEGDTIYCDTWVQGASIGWRRRAALATQPAAGEPVAWIVVDEPFHGVQGIQSGEWDIELDAKAIESLAQDNSPGRIALFTAAPPAAVHVDEADKGGEQHVN